MIILRILITMEDKKNKQEIGWFEVIIGVLAILSIKSLFEHDNSKIVSKKGAKFLEDKEKMKELKEKINELETNEAHNEIFI